MKKIPRISYVSILLNLKFGGFGIGYGIGRNYRPIRVSVVHYLGIISQKKSSKVNMKGYGNSRIRH